jgi:hypothetical protein
MSLLAVKNIVVIVLFVPIACLVLGMRPDLESANISEEEERHWNEDSSPVAIP